MFLQSFCINRYQLMQGDSYFTVPSCCPVLYSNRPDTNTGWFSLHTITPVIWASSKIGNRDNANVARLHLIDDAKGESADQTAACILGHRRPCVRELNDTSNCRVDLLGELQTESGSGVFIVFDSTIKLCFRILMEVKSHFPYFARILEKTSSPGTSLTSPASIWDMRRSASSAQR